MSEQAPKFQNVAGAGIRIGIVAARFNQPLVDSLLEHVLGTCRACGVEAEDLEVYRTPGAHELPYAVGMLAKSGDFDAVVALGVVIAGETKHHDVLAHTTAQSLQAIALDTEVPVINGILTTETEAQAVARSRGRGSRGPEFAQAALEMAELQRLLAQRLDELEAESLQPPRPPGQGPDTGLGGEEPFRN